MIVGAGCAGLSLAVQLALQRFEGRVVLLDPRTEYGDDHTWCFFDLVAHPFQDAVAHRWHRWTVTDTCGDTVRAHSNAVAYAHLPSRAFYERAFEIIDQADNIVVKTGTAVTGVTDRGRDVLVEADAETDAGTNAESTVANWVFDSRPVAPLRAPHRDEVNWTQHFLGWFVRSESPIFDRTEATLMDFSAPDSPTADPGVHGVHFVYVLPFSEHEALIEDTYFSSVPLPRERYETSLRDYLERLGVTAYEVQRTEQGRIPMTTVPFDPQPSPRVARIGVAGGLARPSTGYAFSAIQRHSQALAECLVTAPPEGTLPRLPRARRRRAEALDHVFLKCLRDHPDDAPELFCTLFRNNPPERLARFLQETSSPIDDLHVMNSLPPGKLVPEAARSTVRRGLRFARSRLEPLWGASD